MIWNDSITLNLVRGLVILNIGKTCIEVYKIILKFRKKEYEKDE